MDRLYRPRSVLDIDDYGKVDTVWIPLRAERIRLAPYPMLIDSYNLLSSSERSMAKGYVDEFFSLYELNVLKEYLEGQREISLMVESISIPCICRDANNTVARPLRSMTEEEGWRSFQLDRRSEMDLPFDIAGYFSISSVQ